MSTGIAAVDRRSLAVQGQEWQEDTKNCGHGGRRLGPNWNPWCPEQTEKCCVLGRAVRCGAVCSVHVPMALGCIAVGEEGGRAQLHRGWLTKTEARSCLCSRQAASNICTSFLRPFLLVVASLRSYWCNSELVFQLLLRRCLCNAFLSCAMRSPL